MLDRFALVTAKIVEHDDITWFKRRNQNLDIGLKAVANRAAAPYSS